MLVKCIGNDAASLPPHYRSMFAPEGCRERRWRLLKGKIYVACAINMFAGRQCYLVRMEDSYAPEFMPAPLFAIIDGRLSTQWRYWAVKVFYENNLECVIGYPELTDDTPHYDELIDGKPEAVLVFEKRLVEMEKELLGSSPIQGD